MHDWPKGQNRRCTAEMIDALHGRIDQLRSANQRLGLQNEVLVAMIAAPPQLDAMRR